MVDQPLLLGQFARLHQGRIQRRLHTERLLERVPAACEEASAELVRRGGVHNRHLAVLRDGAQCDVQKQTRVVVFHLRLPAAVGDEGGVAPFDQFCVGLREGEAAHHLASGEEALLAAGLVASRPHPIPAVVPRRQKRCLPRQDDSRRRRQVPPERVLHFVVVAPEAAERHLHMFAPSGAHAEEGQGGSGNGHGDVSVHVPPRGHRELPVTKLLPEQAGVHLCELLETSLHFLGEVFGEVARAPIRRDHLRVLQRRVPEARELQRREQVTSDHA
mmetsp:Transcript_8195/g.23423  ORF Transcript_8195/g.23423 Transcript_8195/m.23423 type:complete len:274 (-) Transcript_8195:572-1393(-)